MIWQREEYIAHCNFSYTGREMFCELFGPLIGLEAEWALQGASEAELSLQGFDWDYVLKTSLSAECFANTGMTDVILEDTPEYQITLDGMGRRCKLCKDSATIPLPLTHPVATMDDWLKIKHWYAFSEDRVDKEQLLRQRALWEKGYLTVMGVPGGFDEPRQLLGEEGLCIAAYEEPELIEDILATIGNLCVKVLERVLAIVPIDCLSIHEDMAGKSGPLFGPSQITQFLLPYYQKVWAPLKDAGCTLFSQDSDGDMNAVLDNFLDCGINMSFPCEPGAGMDIVSLRKKYGKRLAFKGGIDKYVLRGTKADILRELEYKICAETMGGGTVFGIDHRIPNGVPLENYRYYVNTAREMLLLPPVSSLGFERMAF